MDERALREVLEKVQGGELTADEGVALVRRLPFRDLGFARVDHHRHLRQGFPEAVFGPGKSAEQCAAIVAELLAEDAAPVLLTRATAAQQEAALARNPGGEVFDALVVWRPRPVAPDVAETVVVTAGTADLPVARECTAVLGALGLPHRLLADCGVAGLHRLLASVPDLDGAGCVVVVAGMDGALASVVGGLVAAPVVAVPTSVGYGASLAGVTPLLSMLSSCAAGLTVVGIDNGFGAAFAAARLLR